MQRGWLYGLELYHTPDDGTQAGGTAPEVETAPDATETSETAKTAPAEKAETPADTPDAPDSAEDDEDEPELSAEEWQAEASRARKQAANYRTKLRTAEAQIATLQQQLSAAQSAPATDPAQEAETRAQAAERRALIAESAAEAGVPAPVLRAFSELQAATDADAVSAALGKIKGFLAPASAGTSRPPEGASTPPTLDQQIAEAERSGNARAAIALKAKKLAGS
jgi:hypothetical protein